MAIDLIEALRTTGAIREFTDEPVTDDQLARILDTARFAPNGGNAQSWHVVVLKDAARRRTLRDLYVSVWRRYLAQAQRGLRPWAPVTDRDAERAAIDAVDRGDVDVAIGDFAEHLDDAPALLVLLADLRLLAAIDRDHARYTFVGGASVYPFAWSILLAARAEGLGGVITTMAVGREEEVRALLGVPPEHAVAGVIVLGHPVRRPTRLTRKPVPQFATIDAFDGLPLGEP